jgi:hypothetical protein
MVAKYGVHGAVASFVLLNLIVGCVSWRSGSVLFNLIDSKSDFMFSWVCFS